MTDMATSAHSDLHDEDTVEGLRALLREQGYSGKYPAKLETQPVSASSGSTER